MDTLHPIQATRAIPLMRCLRDFYETSHGPNTHLGTEVSPFTLHAYKLAKCEDIEGLLPYEFAFRECIYNGREISSLEPYKKDQIRTSLDTLLISYIFDDLKRVCVIANTTLNAYTELLRNLEKPNENTNLSDICTISNIHIDDIPTQLKRSIYIRQNIDHNISNNHQSNNNDIHPKSNTCTFINNHHPIHTNTHIEQQQPHINIDKDNNFEKNQQYLQTPQNDDVWSPNIKHVEDNIHTNEYINGDHKSNVCVGNEKSQSNDEIYDEKNRYILKPSTLIKKLTMSAVPSNPPSPRLVEIYHEKLGLIPKIYPPQNSNVNSDGTPYQHTDSKGSLCEYKHKSRLENNHTPSSSTSTTSSTHTLIDESPPSYRSSSPGNRPDNTHSSNSSEVSLPLSPSLSSCTNGFYIYNYFNTPIPAQCEGNKQDSENVHEMIENHNQSHMMHPYGQHTDLLLEPHDLLFETSPNPSLLQLMTFNHSNQHTHESNKKQSTKYEHIKNTNRSHTGAKIEPFDILANPIGPEPSSPIIPSKTSSSSQAFNILLDPNNHTEQQKCIENFRLRSKHHIHHREGKRAHPDSTYEKNSSQRVTKFDLDNLASQEVPLQGVSYDKIKKRWIAGIRKEQGKYLRKYFSVARFGMEGAKKLAIEARIQYGLPINRKTHVHTHNSSVVVLRNKRWIARWQENGRTKAKGFSINEHGNEKAHQYALNCYKEMVDKNRTNPDCIDTQINNFYGVNESIDDYEEYKKPITHHNKIRRKSTRKSNKKKNNEEIAHWSNLSAINRGNNVIGCENDFNIRGS